MCANENIDNIARWREIPIYAKNTITGHMRDNNIFLKTKTIDNKYSIADLTIHDLVQLKSQVKTDRIRELIDHVISYYITKQWKDTNKRKKPVVDYARVAEMTNKSKAWYKAVQTKSPEKHKFMMSFSRDPYTSIQMYKNYVSDLWEFMSNIGYEYKKYKHIIEKHIKHKVVFDRGVYNTHDEYTHDFGKIKKWIKIREEIENDI